MPNLEESLGYESIRFRGNICCRGGGCRVTLNLARTLDTGMYPKLHGQLKDTAISCSRVSPAPPASL